MGSYTMQKGELYRCLKTLSKILLPYKIKLQIKTLELMKKAFYLVPVFILLTSVGYAKKHKPKKGKKTPITYHEYATKYGESDTTMALINLFYDKREYGGIGQMSLLPVTGAVTIAVPPIGIGLSLISTPLFVKGLITYNRYSPKNLDKTLTNYIENNTLSKRMRVKVSKRIMNDQLMKEDELTDAKHSLLNSIK